MNKSASETDSNALLDPEKREALSRFHRLLTDHEASLLEYAKATKNTVDVNWLKSSNQGTGFGDVTSVPKAIHDFKVTKSWLDQEVGKDSNSVFTNEAEREEAVATAKWLERLSAYLEDPNGYQLYVCLGRP